MHSKLTILLLMLTHFVWGQNPDVAFSVPLQDTSQAKSMEKGVFKGFFKGDYPNPKKAALLSLVIPGAGQVYNKKYWKLPIVYGAIGTCLWIEFHNINQYVPLRDNYRYQVDGDPNTNPTEAPYIYLTSAETKYYRDQAKRSLEQSSLALGLVYLLSATDAFVDAHLNSFDVSDDLTMKLVPKTQVVPGWGPSFGIGISIPLGVARP